MTESLATSTSTQFIRLNSAKRRFFAQNLQSHTHYIAIVFFVEFYSKRRYVPFLGKYQIWAKLSAVRSTIYMYMQALIHGYPTDSFANPSHDASELKKIHLSPDLEAQKVCKVRSGGNPSKRGWVQTCSRSAGSGADSTAVFRLDQVRAALVGLKGRKIFPAFSSFAETTARQLINWVHTPQ